MSSTAIDVRKKQLVTIKGFLDKALPQIQNALPNVGLTPETLARTAFTAILDAPHLHSADPKTLVKCIIEAAQLGLSFDKALGQAALVPYKGKVQLQPMYRGLVTLAYRSQMVKKVESRAVFEGDDFIYQYGLNERLDHNPRNQSEENEANLRFVYAIVTLTTGAQHFDVMDKAAVMKIRARSKAWQNDPTGSSWATDYVEMAKKTVLRRAMKLTPLSTSYAPLARAIYHDDAAEAGLPQILADGFFPEDEAIDVKIEQTQQGEKKPTASKLAEDLKASHPSPATGGTGRVGDPDPSEKPAAAPVEETTVQPTAPATEPANEDSDAIDAEITDEDGPQEPWDYEKERKQRPTTTEEKPATKKRGRPSKAELERRAAEEERPASPSDQTIDVTPEPAPEKPKATPVQATAQPPAGMQEGPKIRLKKALGADEDNLKKLSMRVLDYERDSFEDVYEREAVLMLNALEKAAN